MVLGNPYVIEACPLRRDRRGRSGGEHLTIRLAGESYGQQQHPDPYPGAGCPGLAVCGPAAASRSFPGSHAGQARSAAASSRGAVVRTARVRCQAAQPRPIP